MRLIKPRAELIEQTPGLNGIYKQIELAGRTCYKSEDKIMDVLSINVAHLPENITINDIPNYKEHPTECIKFLKEHNIKYNIISSAKDFVNRMIKSKHYSMLEHGTVYLMAIDWDHDPLRHYKNNDYSKYRVEYLEREQCQSDVSYKRAYYVTTNLRVLVENGWLDDLKYICEPTEFHKRRITLKLITDRGVSHELVRHRVFSFAQESQRYCAYNKEKFGKEVTFIIPSWSCISPGTYVRKYDADGVAISSNYGYVGTNENFLDALNRAELSYFTLLDKGISPQEARAVLPNATKTEIVMTGYESDWKHFFDLRLRGITGKPHPDMLELAELMHEQLKQKGIEL